MNPLLDAPEIREVPDVDTPQLVSVLSILEQRQFKPGISPPPLRPIYSLGGSIISTPGNLTSITSAIKTGKSAVIGAMIASALADGNAGDLLGFTSSNPKGFALLHFDSEQSPGDHWYQVTRALKRAGRGQAQLWLHSYCLTGLGCKQGWECVTAATRAAAEQHGGIHSILIDGVADFVADVNDAAASNAFVAELHDFAINFDCAIIGVIHFNPGTEKTRGHLGSQLERKAETNLRLDKADGVTTIWSDKQRRAPIPKDTGPRFSWNDDAGMHLSCGTNEARRESASVERMRLELGDVFNERKAMRYSDLKSTVISTLTVSARTAERKIAAYRHHELITQSVAGLFVFNA